MAEKEKKAKPELTPEQRAKLAQERMEEDLFMVQIAQKQKDEDQQKLVLSRLKGKFTQSFIDEAVSSKEITQKIADWLKEQGKIGVMRVGGGRKSIARPWRWQIDVKEDSPTGEALISLEKSVAKLYKDTEEERKVIDKWFKNNTDDKTGRAFNTYFAKVKESKENAKTKN